MAEQLATTVGIMVTADAGHMAAQGAAVPALYYWVGLHWQRRRAEPAAEALTGMIQISVTYPVVLGVPEAAQTFLGQRILLAVGQAVSLAHHRVLAEADR